MSGTVKRYRMHIMFLSASIGGGGAERVVAELATELSERGHEVDIVVIGSSRNDYSIAPGVNVIDCSQKSRIPGLGFFLRVLKINRIARDRKPDACISFNTTVNIYAALGWGYLGKNLILAERNDPLHYPVSKASRFLRRILYSKRFRYAFQTPVAQAYFSKEIRDNSTVIFNPINPDMPDVFTGERTKRIVTALRLEPQKNIKLAIDAMKLLRETHPEYVLEIYGDGNQRDELAAYIASQDLNDHVKLMGRSNRIYDDILDASIFVLPSDFEGMSNSMLEAMALGIPTISTDYPSGGARAIIDSGKNGILIPVGDLEALYQALIRIIEDPEFAAQISRNGQLLRQQLSVSKITQQWLDFICS